MPTRWWQDTIIYQVYLRSFQDTNADGIGDLQGVIKRLDYVRDLGIDTVWISPHFDSPMDDNGYDVRDFCNVSPDYGTLDDFKALLSEAHARNMKIIIDMIVNHTSDEHPWFLAAKDPTHPDHTTFRDFYIWQPPRMNDQGNPERPTSWVSWFGGSTWTYNPPTNDYYLHIFSAKMPDLNWRNPAVRVAMKAVIQFWIDLGVDGFRLDASNHLEKNWDFPEANPGYEHFSNLPKHHEYLEELSRALFEPYDLLIIGEAGSASREEALRYAGYDSHEFNLLIHFEHCWADIDEANNVTPGKWAKGSVDVTKIKRSFAKWQQVFANQGWNVLYWHNHDQPRIVSHYGDDAIHHRRSALMLAYCLYLLPGTPIVYYGEEIGMTNVDYNDLSDFRDVEVFTEYGNFKQNGAHHETAMQALRDRCRDNARTPMQWDDSPHAGFSTATPWMKVNGNHSDINVKTQQKQPDSIWQTYKTLLHLRKHERLNHGKVTFYTLDHEQAFVYCVTGKTHDYLVIANFTDKPMRYPLDSLIKDYTLYVANVKNAQAKSPRFAPFEARIYRHQHNRTSSAMI